MSRFPNFIYPVIGLTGIALGAAYAIPTRTYKAQEAEVAMLQAATAEERAAAAEARIATSASCAL